MFVTEFYCTQLIQADPWQMALICLSPQWTRRREFNNSIKTQRDIHLQLQFNQWINIKGGSLLSKPLEISLGKLRLVPFEMPFAPNVTATKSRGMIKKKLISRIQFIFVLPFLSLRKLKHSCVKIKIHFWLNIFF